MYKACTLHLHSRLQAGGGGTLVFEVEYRPRKKPFLGLFVRTRQCTRVHRLGVQKRAKLGKKGMFLVISTNFWKGHDAQIQKNACKTRI